MAGVPRDERRDFRSFLRAERRKSIVTVCDAFKGAYGMPPNVTATARLVVRVVRHFRPRDVQRLGAIARKSSRANVVLNASVYSDEKLGWLVMSFANWLVERDAKKVQP